MDPKIDDVLEIVNLKGHEKIHDRLIKTFSGGQQAQIVISICFDIEIRPAFTR